MDLIGHVRQISLRKDKDLLYHPVLLSHYLHSLGNYTRRAMFSKMGNINQSSLHFHCEPL